MHNKEINCHFVNSFIRIIALLRVDKNLVIIRITKIKVIKISVLKKHQKVKIMTMPL